MSKTLMTVTEVSDKLGVTTKTIVRWEKSGKVAKPKRDWRGWRAYDLQDFRRLKAFKEALIEETVVTVKSAAGVDLPAFGRQVVAR